MSTIRALPKMDSRIWRARKPLTLNWSPPDVVDRVEEWRELAVAVQDYRCGDASSCVLLQGAPGLGKSLLARRFAQSLAREREGSRPASVVAVDAHDVPSESALLWRIQAGLDPGASPRGYQARERLGDIQRLLKARRRDLVLVVDEADCLVDAELERLLFSLSRHLEAADLLVAVVLVGQDFGRHRLGGATLSGVGRLQVVSMRPYSSEVLADILAPRVRHAFAAGTCPGDVVSAVADVASVVGDARFALELLKRAADHADGRGASRIAVEDVHALEGQARSLEPLRVVESLTVSERRVFEAVLEATDGGIATTGEVLETYRRRCEAGGVDAVAYTMLWKMLKRLQYRHLVMARLSGRGHEGTTQLFEVHPDVRSAVAEGGAS